MDTDTGDPAGYDYRRWVGPAVTYDVMSGLQFSILFALGLREEHRLVDVGCGSLRAGRLLIPYLRPDRYCGLEPFARFVEEGIAAELGEAIVAVKRPRFSHRDDFVLDDFAEQFDFALAQSIFSHTHPTLLVHALSRIADVLADDGLLVATFVPATHTKFANVVEPVDDAGWAYPHAVRYSWQQFSAHLRAAGLHGTQVSWRHPYQSWFVASRGRAHLGAEKKLRAALFEPSRYEAWMVHARRTASRARKRLRR